MTTQSKDPERPETDWPVEISPDSPYELFILSVSVMALAVIILYLFFPLPIEIRQILAIVDVSICAVFLIDFFRSLFLAPRKLHYLLRWGWIDFLGSMPFHPLFRLLRIARILIAARNLYGMPLREIFREVRVRRAQSTLFIMLFTMYLVITISSSVVVMAEVSAPDANIETGAESLWWAFVTVTTVGYGDYFPITGVGRFFAGVLMIFGVGLFTVLTSYIAKTFIRPGRNDGLSRSAEDNVDSERLAKIQVELAEIKQMLSELQKD